VQFFYLLEISSVFYDPNPYHPRRVHHELALTRVVIKRDTGKEIVSSGNGIKIHPPSCERFSKVFYEIKPARSSYTKVLCARDFVMGLEFLL
jgi:hypothetical protein